ncbi:thioesterase II family protein [Bdellovibrio sp. HCB337]|uniref:thioesterase II family protein n=1 Tax=Bdellovibrio sp. HCB337 TaxID=3394358 RepID=UPI0039A54F52
MTPVLRKVPNSSGQQRLIFFHHAGGNGAQYFPSLKPLISKYEIYCMDLPGRFFRSNEDAFTNMQDLTKALAAQILQLDTKPTFLLGHSFGALVAYTLAWELVNNPAAQLKALGLSALKAPIVDRSQGYATMATLSDEALVLEIEKFEALPEVVKREPTILKFTLKALREDFTIMASFKNTHSHEKLAVPSLILGGDSDPQVTEQDLEKWSTLVDTRNKPLMFTGHHFYLFSHFEKAVSNLATLEN